MNLQKMMKQAQQMQKKMEEAQAELENIEVTGSSGGDMVQITLNGKGIMKSAKIDPKVIDPDDLEMLEDLIVAAANDAKNKVDEESNKKMQDAAGGMMPPGMKMPF